MNLGHRVPAVLVHDRLVSVNAPVLAAAGHAPFAAWPRLVGEVLVLHSEPMPHGWSVVPVVFAVRQFLVLR